MLAYCFSCKNKINLTNEDLIRIRDRMNLTIDGIKLKPLTCIDCVRKTQSQIIVDRRLYLNLDCDKRRY